MGTFTKAVVKSYATFTATINSSNGSILQNQLIYECPANKRGLLMATFAVNPTINAANNFVVELRKQDPYTSNYSLSVGWTWSSQMAGGLNTPVRIYMSDDNVRSVSNYGISASDFSGAIFDGSKLNNCLILLFPGDRIYTGSGGTTGNGNSGLRISGTVELYT